MDKQFNIYSINFRAFYTDEELKINNEIMEIFNKMHSIEFYYGFLTKYKVSKEELSYEDYVSKRLIKGELNKYYKTREEENRAWKNYLRKLTLSERKREVKDRLRRENKESKKLANSDVEYLELRKSKIKKNKELGDLLSSFNKSQRTLREDLLVNENAISLFDNSLSRTIEIECDNTEVNKDIICITISHYDVMNQLINNGFEYYDKSNDETYKYRVLTSSAGQIRKKKIVFIKENIWQSFNYSIMCGLSWDRINNLGGMNVNKFLAYLALQNSATDELKGFNIDECIVVDDFETILKDREVDYIEKKSVKTINKKTGEEVEKLVIKNPKRCKKDILISHTDGCGMILKGDKSYQIRLPFLKGLMTPVNYVQFCNETKGATTKVIDLWGKEWDVVKDNITYIFTKSQFKMSKYYTNIYANEGDKEPFVYGWDVYKACFRTYNCTASYCNKEENKNDFRKGQFNYQYWQSLTDVKDEEIEHFTKPISDRINKCHYDIKTMLEVFGVSNKNNRMNIEQKILKKYPVLLKDFHFQDGLSGKLSKVKKEAKSGKFKTNSINTFLLPDIYAWLENLFCKIENPKGLLADGEVSCQYFNNDKLLLDRSPHLFLEHAVRNNINKNNCIAEVKKELMSKYYVTNGMYASTHDLITKLLMYDVDGDHTLTTNDTKLIDIVERNCKDIIPLYYDMGKAEAQPINTNNIISSLKSAFKYGNIGVYSNKITNLWNTDNFDEDTLTLIKLLTAMNNYSIDSAKTLEMVELDSEENKMYKSLLRQANGDMPYFFQFAKDKPKESVSNKTNSTVNRICDYIENNSIDNYEYDFSKLGKFNSNYLYNKKVKDIDIESESSQLIINRFEEIDKEKNMLFKNSKSNKHETNKVAVNIYEVCKDEFKKYIKELNITFEEASDILIKYHFTQKKDFKKTLLFNVFGEIILNNLNKNLKDKTFGFCDECGNRFDKVGKNTSQKYCKDCAKVIKNEQNKRYYNNLGKA